MTAHVFVVVARKEAKAAKEAKRGERKDRMVTEKKEDHMENKINRTFGRT